MQDLKLGSIYDSLIEQIKEIDTEGLSDNVENNPQMKIIEKQKVYFWIRLILKEELDDIKVGDDFKITYKFSGEDLMTKFIAYGKKNLNRDLDKEIVSYDPEDDKKILTLMVDSDEVWSPSRDLLLELESNKIPFIRTLFKTSPYYQFQVYKRSDLTFTNQRTNQDVEYIDCDF
jgi:hypothetical protein